MNQVSGQFAQYNDPKWNLIDLIHSVSYPANHYTSIISLAFGVVFSGLRVLGKRKKS